MSDDLSVAVAGRDGSTDCDSTSDLQTAMYFDLIEELPGKQ